MAYSRGVAERDAAMQRLAISTAWHAAAFARARKRLPRLAGILRKITGPRPRTRAPLTPAQQLNQLNALALAFGGKPLARVPRLKRRPDADAAP